jgi:hypothetical protein
MKKVEIIALLAAATMTAGCAHKTVLRDSRVYEAELDQYTNWATQQAMYLRGFIEEHCICESEAEGPQFNDQDCEKAADYVLTIEARADWHKSMSLWNAGLIESEPSEQPPEIAPLMCPLPPAPGTSDEDRIEAEEAAAEATTPALEPEAAPAPAEAPHPEPAVED